MIGRQVSHFYIIRKIGSGGMGVVYEAQDTRLPRSVAIKFLKPTLLGSDDALKRFTREARLAASLNHPNICTVLEVGEADSQSFIVMELLQGLSLKARLSAGRLSLTETLDIGGQVASALAAAQDQGIIHRDLTPGNVFLTESGLVKLLDFGLAKQSLPADAEGDSTDGLTGPDAIVGTIHYMAPERLVDTTSVDYRCDLFSLGAVLYHMATGAPPFDMSPRQALVTMICTQPPVPLRQLSPQCPADLERIVNRLLDKKPGGRYQSAHELRSDLAALESDIRKASGFFIADPPTSNSVAVLRFELIGKADAKLETFRDALAENISARLSRLVGLRVAPRTSTRNLSGLGVRDIGERLGVRMVLEGTIQRCNDELRITVNLVDSVDERSLCPMLCVDRLFDDSVANQDMVVAEICDAVTAALVRAQSHHPAADPDAIHAFKRGQHYWRECFSGGWRHAIDNYEHAIARDPNFAPAHVALANAYNFSGFYSLMKPGLSFSVAAKAAHRALAIDPGSASAYRELALAKFGGEWNWEGSEDAFRHALALDPMDAAAHVQYSWLLILLGRDDAAFAEAQRAQALAPSSRLVAASRAQTLYIGGQYDQAIAICTECLHGDPAYVWAVQLRGLCHLARSTRDAAITDLELAAALSHRTPFYLGLLGRCYGQFRMRAEALALVAELKQYARSAYVPPQCYVFIYAGLGEQTRALEYQEEAYADGASPFNYLTPSIRGLYALDPYHKRRLEQMRLSL